MKRLILWITLWTGGMGLMHTDLAFGEKVKIGLIDAQKIMRESKAAKRAQAVFIKDREAKMAILMGRQEEVRSLEEELKREGGNMSPSVRKEKTEQLARQIKELRRLRSDLDEELKKKNIELKQKILQEIREIVEEFLKKEKYTVILEKRWVVAADETIDITGKIIRLYDAVK